MRHHKNNLKDVFWGVVMLTLFALLLHLFGCSSRRSEAPYSPDFHPGTTVTEKYYYCQRHHEGVHLPYDPNFECGREYP